MLFPGANDFSPLEQSITNWFFFPFKAAQKSLKEALKDIAVFEAKTFLALDPRPPVFFHHRQDGDIDYLNAIINEMNDEVGEHFLLPPPQDSRVNVIHESLIIPVLSLLLGCSHSNEFHRNFITACCPPLSVCSPGLHTWSNYFNES